MKIGVLAIQGSVIEHSKALEELEVDVQPVRSLQDLSKIQGIILPGGESTAQSKLLQRFDLFEPLQKKIKQGLPVWGTCAGAILLAREVTGKNAPPTLEVMNIRVERNAYGAHRESFIHSIECNIDQKKCSIEAVFIRAPQIHPLHEDVQILALWEEKAVMLREENMLVTAFHPELTENTSVHEYFLRMCQSAQS